MARRRHKDYMQAWCECSHCASWHDETGRCTHLASRLDHATRSNINVPCECFELRVAHVEVITAEEFEERRRARNLAAGAEFDA